jgi:thiosulfate/3-mercaptopyruvate sulfurtransferase
MNAEYVQKIVEKGLIEPQEAHKLFTVGAVPVVFVDATFGMAESLAGQNQILKDRWAKKRIHNAVFFDVDRVCSPDSDPVTRPHMLPGAEDFGRAVGTLGIPNTALLIVYAQESMASAAPRAWWMFRVFGHHNVVVLNGSLKTWESEGLPVVTAPPAPAAPAVFHAKPADPALIVPFAGLKKASQSGDIPILDARPPGRFAGTEPEPRPGISSGHMPHSFNIPAGSLLDSAGKLLPENELFNIFQDFKGRSYVSCGSGVTACMLAFARYVIGLKNTPVSDESWAIWAQDPENPVLKTMVCEPGPEGHE